MTSLKKTEQAISSAIPNTIPSSVLMVCLGNICRSPMAEEVLRQKATQAGLQMSVDSCGTGNWHAGEQADHRSRSTAKARGYDIDSQKARQITADDFLHFDLLLAMDKNNLADIQQLKQGLIAKGANPSELASLALFSEHDAKYHHQKVPDPYYGDMSDFSDALDKIESMADSWIAQWK